MSIRKIKRIIYRKIQKLIFWKRIMYYVQKVRIKNNKVFPAAENEIIEPPDETMWAIYKRGENTPEAICGSSEKAESICETLNNELKKNKKLGWK